MKIEQFALERMQSTYENQVDINLSESGVSPMKVSELVDDAVDRDALLGEALRYTQSNGTLPLRATIAACQICRLRSTTGWWCSTMSARRCS